MLIRGLDFARHNVIVGGPGAEPALPNQSPNSQNKGETVARVVAASGQEATLEMGGQRVVVESHVALNVGDKLYVRVFQQPDSSLRLQVLSSGPSDGLLAALDTADVDNLLTALDVPVDNRTRLAARSLLARDGTVDKGELEKLVNSLRQFPGAGARQANAAALLLKADAPVDEANMALMSQRAMPDAPPQLGARLMAVGQALESLQRQLPTRSALQAQVAELKDALAGLPLDEKATPQSVGQALKTWLARLQPTASATPPSAPPAAPAVPTKGPVTPQPANAAAGASAPAGAGVAPPTTDGPPAAGAPAVPRAEVATVLKAVLQTLAEADGRAADAPQRASAANAAAVPQPAGGEDAGKQGIAPLDRVSPSQHGGGKLGITPKAPGVVPTDLASMLDRLGAALGPEHEKIQKLVKEASAELRYTQIANAAPPDQGSQRAEFLVPLMVPQLSPEHPEGRIQVFHQANGKNEPIDPQNVRMVFVLDTTHLGTVQADLGIRNGVIDLTVGVADPADRDFMAKSLGELEAAITQLGWQTGRFGARQAKALPPKVRQEEGLSNIVHFDRRV